MNIKQLDCEAMPCLARSASIRSIHCSYHHEHQAHFFFPLHFYLYF
jgi:hypothetical protein